MHWGTHCEAMISFVGRVERWRGEEKQWHLSEFKPLCLKLCSNNKASSMSFQETRNNFWFQWGVHDSVCMCKICLEGIGIKLNWVK